MDKFYESLGSIWLTSKIKEKSIEVGPGKTSEKALEIQDLILSRKALLLNDINTCNLREGLRKNAQTLIENIRVLEVTKIRKELILGDTVKFPLH